eukprot:gene55280-54184_t
MRRLCRGTAPSRVPRASRHVADDSNNSIAAITADHGGERGNAAPKGKKRRRDG